MRLDARVKKLEQRSDAAESPPAALILLPDCDEAAEREAFEKLHGRPPALVIRCTAKDARVRPDPDEATPC
ncbi:hypothetical protein [Aromatoleum evansii]|uniref:hypothetical protein n=1 Tax=Aromatoleum evansii TaxID=59406 RepID=UPI00145EF769|nr:hypothetical protein [Aromatoleum evansii]NMG32358.1 hypothetical protein [Aromatoleum evansii]